MQVPYGVSHSHHPFTEPYMKTNLAKFSLPLLIASSLVLSACSSNEGEAPVAAVEKAAEPSSPQPTAQRLTKEQVATTIEQVGSLGYNAADDTLVVSVKVTNNGTASLPHAGANPVSLGVLQMVPAASGTPTRGQELRVQFESDVAPSTNAELIAVIPAALAVGNTVQLELVQEGVAWFGYDFQQPTLILGPFARCTDGKALCDADGKAIAAK